MKKSILTLFAVAVTFGAIAQVNTINQGANGVNNKVKMIQKGNTEDRITQNGSNGTVSTFQKAVVNNYGNSVTISQLGSTNDVETDQSGRYNSITITEAGSFNKANITQIGGGVTLISGNALTLNQPGGNNTFESLQNGNSNTLNMTANGNYGTSYISQDFNNSGLVNLTQDGTKDDAKIYQGASSANNFAYTTSISNTVNAKQNGYGGPTTGALASFLVVYQWGDTNSIGISQEGYNNRLTITQSGDRNKIVGLTNSTNPLEGVQKGNGNTGILTQSGTDNTMRYAQIGSNQTVTATQTGNNNTCNVVGGALN